MINPTGLGGRYIFDMYSGGAVNPLPVGTTASTGALCPQKGVWKSETYQVVVGIDKGMVMPRYQNTNVDWVLTNYSLSELNQE